MNSLNYNENKIVVFTSIDKDVHQHRQRCPSAWTKMSTSMDKDVHQHGQRIHQHLTFCALIWL